MRITKRAVLISYVFIFAAIFIGIFLINLIGAKTGVKDALLAGAMFSIPIAIFGGGIGIGLMFRKDADDAYETGDSEDINRKNWENKYRAQK